MAAKENNLTYLGEIEANMLQELIGINNEIAPLQARKDEIEKYLKGMSPGKYTDGVFDVTISPSSRFNKKAFAEAFPYEKFPQFYKEPEPELDVKKIAPAAKEPFTDAYDNKLTIK